MENWPCEIVAQQRPLLQTYVRTVSVWLSGCETHHLSLRWYAAVIPQVMRAHEDHQIAKPTTPLIGRTATGAFHTSAAKEYPGPLCAAMAACIVDQISAPFPTHDVVAPERLSSHMVEFLNSLRMACSNIDEGRSFLPDYQGR